MTGESESDKVKRYRDLLAAERDAAALYRALANADKGSRREVFLRLSDIEERHAAHWESRLRDAGADIPATRGVSARTKLLALLARRLSTGAVLPFVERAERTDAAKYDADPDAAEGMAADERGHATELAKLSSARPSATAGIARRERWHRGDRSGTLRAGVFGVSDGLVSNAALVLGFAGSGAARSTTVLAGVAGLLAGAFSMAAGEYVSMSGQKEMFEREIGLEAQELEEQPGEETEELALIYQAKGLDPDDARRLAERLMGDREVAMDTLTREELGLDPAALGSPWRAAGSSMVTFALGAVVAVVPYLFAAGTAALVAAIAAVAVGLFAVGGGIGLLNGRSVVRSGVRQLVVGAVAAGVTFGIGHLLGASAV